MSELYIFVTSHNTLAQGGKRKTHIHDGSGVLCGRKLYGLPTGTITPGWLLQADPDGELCRVCKEAAAKAVRREIEDEKAKRIAAGKCPECQAELRNEAGCKHCHSCGWSACE